MAKKKPAPKRTRSPAAAKKETGGASRKRDAARGRNAGDVGSTAAFEEVLAKNAETWKDALNKLKTLPDDTYVGLITDVKSFVAKEIPIVTITITTLIGTTSGKEYAAVPVQIWYRLYNKKDPENNYGLNQLLGELGKLGYDEDQLESPEMLMPILKHLKDSDDSYVNFAVKTKSGDSGDFTNYFINGFTPAKFLSEMGIEVDYEPEDEE